MSDIIGYTDEDIDACVACLGDDAESLRAEIDDDERATNMETAAAIIGSLRSELQSAREDAARLKLEHDAVNELLFDGWRVLKHLDSRAAKRMGAASHTAVSDVLDAFVLAYRAAIDAARAGGTK